MRRLRFTAKALLPVLILTAMFMWGCTDDGGSDPQNQNPIDIPTSKVTNFEYTISSTVIDDYFGKVDTLNIQIKGMDENNLGVESAQVILEVTEGPGTILFPDGDKTSVEGIVNAKYVLPVIEDTTAVISAHFGTIAAKTKTITISAADVRISIAASPTESEVDQGATATSDLTIRVQDSQGVTVSGVPVKVELMTGQGSLSTPIVDPATDVITSTFTVDEVNETVSDTIRAYIDVDVPETQTSNAAPSKSKKKSGRSISESILSAKVGVKFIPKSSQVDHISVTITPNQIVAGAGANETAEVIAVAADADNNGVPNLELFFSLRNIDGNNEATVRPSASVPAMTDETGSTTSTISTNGAVGNWALEVRTSRGNQNFWADTLSIVTGDPQNVVVTSDTSRISVFGTNGVETTTIRAQVKDQNGQPVEDGKMVYFLAENYPRGLTDEVYMQIGNSSVESGIYVDPLFPQMFLPFDSAATSAGEAFVSLTAGEKKGQMTLLVWTMDDDGVSRIESRYDGLMIVSGPPYSIEVDYNPTGVQQGSSIYNLEISARVQDIDNNDVEDGYSVSFWVVPEVAHVWDIGITGNPGPISNEPTPGVAYSALSYHSARTNEVVTINALINRYGGLEPARSQIDLKLPIQSAQATMYVTPLNWDYGENGGDACVCTVSLEVRDGYGHLINGQEVLFGSTKGRFMTIDNPNIPFDPEYRAITGPVELDGTPDDDPEGVAVRYFHATFDEAFPDPQVPQTTIQLMAEIVGAVNASVEPITIYLYQ
jgi:hypothetical protein